MALIFYDFLRESGLHDMTSRQSVNIRAIPRSAVKYTCMPPKYYLLDLYSSAPSIRGYKRLSATIQGGDNSNNGFSLCTASNK